MRPADLAWLEPFLNQTTHDVWMHSRFKEIVSAAAPNAIYHFHVDLPLGAAFSAVLSGPGAPVQVRDDRYMLLSACAAAPCVTGRALAWIDLEVGLVFGAIEFNPTNGEPTPTLTIFSAQVGDRVARRFELPPAFLQDLELWSRATRLRGTTVRYFINKDGWKSLVAHDEDACQGADRSSLALTMCAATNADAADQDMRAAYLLLANQFDEKSSMRDALKADQDKWLQDRGALCPGAATDAATVACRLKVTRERTQALTALYAKSGGGH
jgi:uncharacterized protein YecT (DUF1311 family)